MVFNVFMNIPRICLCGQARSGTSMMMRVLQAGGLIIDQEDVDTDILALLRNPYGLFENRTNIINNDSDSSGDEEECKEDCEEEEFKGERTEL